MKKKEIKNFLKPLDKKGLKTVMELAEKQLNSTLGIGDNVTLTIDYMIGDADGDTEESCPIEIKTQDDLNAIEVITHILDNHTDPNSGHWGFSLDESSFSKKPKEVYNILYNQDDAPKTYNGVELTSKVLDVISEIVEECFRSDTEYSFLVYQGYTLEQ